jgi:hypothetical protein
MNLKLLSALFWFFLNKFILNCSNVSCCRVILKHKIFKYIS